VPFSVVYCLGPAARAAAPPAKAKAQGAKKQPPPPELLPIFRDVAKLPAPVREMREAILNAVRSGDIEELRHAFDLNELKPDLGQSPLADPVAHWKQVSGDGQGLEILAILAEILEAGYVIVPFGRDLENNKIYVWPYFAEVPLDKLTPAQEVELLRLVSPVTLRDMKAAGRYTHWRLAIGADGTWHAFRK
jgi:hypothetical protein